MQRRLQALIKVFLLCATSLHAAPSVGRYFKMDHGTGAIYIALKPDSTYEVTGREHMGVSVEESGIWKKEGSRITFTPTRSGAPAYSVEEVTYKGKTFLTIKGENAPGIAIPTQETKDALDKDPGHLPSFVFFEIPKDLHDRETKQTYPFHTFPKPKQ